MAIGRNPKKAILKKDHKSQLALFHPWIFSTAIERVEGSCDPGDVVEVVDSNGQFLAWGYINPESQIAIRILSKEKGKYPDETFIRNRIMDAVSFRRHHFDENNTNAYRLINSEGDHLPGLIVDRYFNLVVIQILTKGMEKYREVIIETLIKALNPKTIWERSDTNVRKKEGLGLVNSLIYGDDMPYTVITENGNQFYVDVKTGQKTGFYLDQRDNRDEVKKYSEDKQILNCFSYTGGFTVYALKARAKNVTNVEFSPSALEILKKNISINGLPVEKVENHLGDAFDILRDMKEKGSSYDLVILDPPKFAQSQSQIKAAIRGYKDINMQGMHLLKPGGVLMTFSCSGAISLELFSKIIAWAAVDAKREVQVIRRLTQPIDHPFIPGFMESEYLKGLIVRIN